MTSSKLSNEMKVGVFFVVTVLLGLGFAALIGVRNPFQRSVDLYVTYNFAGGIDVGSPVRVSGIKVGRVEKIDFFAGDDSKAVALKEPGSSEETSSERAVAPVRLKISVRPDAAKAIRADSRFYINLAGIIGERYIEITPGKRSSPELKSGDVVAGVDPPRIDQIFSQSFDLAGKIADIIQENKGDLAKSIELIYKLSASINQTLAWVDKSAVFKTNLSQLVNNLIDITKDVKDATGKLKTPEGEKTLKLLYNLLWRLEPLDSKNIREFLQKEGVKVHFF